jgi:hypothetical protein
VLGCAIMIVTAFAGYRRNREGAAIALGLIPAVSCIVGGLILAATKLS